MQAKRAVRAVAAAFVAQAVMAQTGDSSNPSDEGLSAGAPFARIIGAPYSPPKPPPAYVPPVALVFDEQGRSNELIVTLAYGNKTALKQIVPTLADTADRQTVEAEVVKAVRQYERAADFSLQSPAAALHLTEDSRLQSADRAELSFDHPRERLEQYLRLRYVSVAAALQAREMLKSNPALATVGNNRRLSVSWAPNDPYFAPRVFPVDPRLYQWGLQEMNFPAAWDVSKGHGFVGVLEPGVPTYLYPDPSVPPDPRRTEYLPADVSANHRAQTAFNDTQPQAPGHFVYHATHVLGIIGATTNNGDGIAGACPTCSTALLKVPSVTTAQGTLISTLDMAFAMTKGVERGLQVLNWSGGYPTQNDTDIDKFYPVCGRGLAIDADVAPICDSIAFSWRRKVLLLTAAGNGETNLADDGVNRPQFPGEHPAVVAVAGAEERFAAPNQQNCHDSFWCQWRGTPFPAFDWRNRSNAPSVNGVYAPARSIVSTVARGSFLDQIYPELMDVYRCSDAERDESGFPNDGYGSCTGTSMAAPHISALAGILRSINPLLPALPNDHNGQSEARMAIRDLIHASGTHTGPPPRDPLWGHGMPNAANAAALAIAQTPNRLTPLFSFYSSGRSDYLYTTVPQMATAALVGTITPYPCVTYPCSPSYRSTGGATIVGYDRFPDSTTQSTKVPRAEVWVFTTPLNPKNASVPLVPLYRFSWKCGDPTNYPPAICATNPQHTDSAYSAAGQVGIDYFTNTLGYRLDGIEGYIYPTSMAQPPGTVRLMRKYNPARDDHAIFPETQLSAMLAAGYTANTGNTDWIGYVYPNTNGNVPAIQ